MNKLVSVVMCTYNGAHYVQEQINTILSQTHPIEELIIVDDASSDDTVQLISQLAKKNERIKLFCNQINLGYTLNFQKAIQLASFEYIAIADQDDYWVNTKLEKMLAAMKPHVACIYCDSVRFSGTIPINPKPNKKNRKIEGSDPIQLAMFNTVSGHAMIIKKSFTKKLPLIPATVYYDWWLAMQATIHGGIQFFPEILVYQRAHENNVTIQKGLSEKQHRNAYRKMLQLHLIAWLAIPNLDATQVKFFKTFHTLWSQSLHQSINIRLFCFLVKHHKELFYYKVRKFPLISAVKVSFLFSFKP